MRVTERKKIEEERDVVIDIRCNRCDRSCMRGAGSFAGATGDFYGAHVEFTTGYYSDPLPDGEMYCFDLCEHCLKELMDAFKTPATNSEYFP